MSQSGASGPGGRSTGQPPKRSDDVHAGAYRLDRHRDRRFGRALVQRALATPGQLAQVLILGDVIGERPSGSGWIGRGVGSGPPGGPAASGTGQPVRERAEAAADTPGFAPGMQVQAAVEPAALAVGKLPDAAIEPAAFATGEHAVTIIDAPVFGAGPDAAETVLDLPRQPGRARAETIIGVPPPPTGGRDSDD